MVIPQWLRRQFLYALAGNNDAITIRLVGLFMQAALFRRWQSLKGTTKSNTGDIALCLLIHIWQGWVYILYEKGKKWSAIEQLYHHIFFGPAYCYFIAIAHDEEYAVDAPELAYFCRVNEV